MSILTKIFVVLATIFSLLLVAVIVPYVKHTSGIKQEWEQTKAQLAVAENRATLVESLLEQTENDLTRANAKLTEQVASLRNDLKDKMTQIQNRDVAVMELRNDVATVQARIGELSSALDQAQKIIEAQKTEIAQRRDRELDLKTKNVDLNDKLAEKITEADMMTQQVRLMRERLTELDTVNKQVTQELERLRGLVTEAKAPVAAPPVPPVKPIRGVITDVRKVGTEGQTFAAVNVGSNDMVSEGMEFIIYDGDQFMGNLTITKVDLNSSAGRVSLAQGPIRRNLEVMAGGM